MLDLEGAGVDDYILLQQYQMCFVIISWLFHLSRKIFSLEQIYFPLKFYRGDLVDYCLQLYLNF